MERPGRFCRARRTVALIALGLRASALRRRPPLDRAHRESRCAQVVADQLDVSVSTATRMMAKMEQEGRATGLISRETYNRMQTEQQKLTLPHQLGDADPAGPAIGLHFRPVRRPSPTLATARCLVPRCAVLGTVGLRLPVALSTLNHTSVERPTFRPHLLRRAANFNAYSCRRMRLSAPEFRGFCV